MSDGIPRLRMFAGPNGSGKSTLKTVLPPELLGVYLNPDDIEKELRASGRLTLDGYRVDFSEADIRLFLKESEFLKKAGLTEAASKIEISEGQLCLSAEYVNSYIASVIVDFFRQRLLATRESFTFETVMSHPGKVALLGQAQQLGYRTYLYFIATDDPEINVSRVNARVQKGGHPVPSDKIVSRYHATLALLMSAVRLTNRAYIFDNSSEGARHRWLAEITNGKEVELKVSVIPAWFRKTVWDQVHQGSAEEPT